MAQEDKRSSSSYFITLTYDTDTVPINEQGQMTLRKKDYQNFMKRLRERTKTYCNANYIDTPKLRYYAVGEYGTRRFRPHYHAILFNCPHPELIYSSWQLGDVHIGTVGGASIAYTTKYIDKPHRVPSYKGDTRQPEFSLSSNGLGDNYVSPRSRAYHREDITGRFFVSTPDGIKIPMPRYYRDKLYTDDEKRQQNIAAMRAQYHDNELHKQEFERKYKDSPNFTFEQYLTAEVYGRYTQFYKNQKPRE